MYQQNQGYAGQPIYGYPPQQNAYPPPPAPAGYPQQQSAYPPPNTSSPPDGGGGGFLSPGGLFVEKAIRQAFVSKVFTILTFQLVFSSAVIGMFVLNVGTKRYFALHQEWMFVGLIVCLVTMIILACVESARRTTPINMILLCVLTAGYAFEAAVISCRYSTTVVMFAFLATGLSCFLLALFARTTSFDMTNCGTTLCLIGLAHMVIGMILIAVLVPLGYASAGSLILSISGAMLASLYFVFDLQLIMGGRQCELSPEEYVMAAVVLYVDIMQIFLYLLEIISRLTKD